MAAKSTKKSDDKKNTTSSKKSSTAKKSTATKSTTSESSTAIKTSSPDVTESTTQNSSPWKSILIGGLVVLLLILLVAWLNKDQFIVAWVNGKPITQTEYVKEMEKQVGRNTMEMLVMQALILQEASDQGVTVDQAEIDAEFKLYEDRYSQQGQNLDTLLAQDGLSRSDLAEQIRMQKIVEVLSAGDTEVSDEEVAGFLETNQSLMPEDMSEEEMQEMAREQIQAQSQQTQIQSWLEGLKAKATINYWKAHTEAPILAPEIQ